MKMFAIPFPNISYQILCPKQLQGVNDPKKCADLILQSTGLADDAFRLGNTKAWFQYHLVEIRAQLLHKKSSYNRACEFID